MARHPGVRLLHERKPGPGPARNLGVQNAAAPLLCFIDADCLAHPDWLAVALRSFGSLPARTILGGEVLIWYANPAKYTAVEVYELIFAYRQRLHIERHRYSGTGNLVVRRADFEEIGPFRGILTPEDRDWGDRATAAGFAFKYIPNMIVFHRACPSFKSLRVQWDRDIRHALTRARRQRANWRIYWIARALIILCSPTAHAVWILAAREMPVLKRCQAVAILVGIRSYRAWRMISLLRSSLGRGVLWNRASMAGGDELE